VGKERCPAVAEQGARNQLAGQAAQDHENDNGRGHARSKAGWFWQSGPGLESGSARGAARIALRMGW